MNTTTSLLTWLTTICLSLPYFIYFAFPLPTNTQRFIAFLPILVVALGEFGWHVLFDELQYGKPLRFLLAGMNFGICARIYLYLCLLPDYDRQQLLKLRPWDVLYNHLLTVRQDWRPKPRDQQKFYETYVGRVIQLIVMLSIFSVVHSQLHSYDTVTVLPLWRIQSASQFLLLLQYSTTFVFWLYLFIHSMSEFNSLVLLPTLTLGYFPVITPLFGYMFQPLVDSTSLTTFWSTSWQQMLKSSFQMLVFNPVQRQTATKSNPRGIVPLAVLLVFLSSGLLHEWALQCSFSSRDTKRPTYAYTQILFFTMHGLLCLVERFVVRSCRQYITLPSAVSRLLTLTILFLSSTVAFSAYAETNWQHDLPLTVRGIFMPSSY